MTAPHLLTIARDIALAAADLADRRRREGVEVAASKSSPEDVVTHADRETEQLIRSMIADARPDDGFYGEESGAETGTSGLTWIVDPIDGTVNYLYDIPHWAVSVAVVEGEPDPLTWTALAGAVVNPRAGEVYSAALGAGSYLGERRLAVAETELPLALVGTGFSYSASRRVEQARDLVGLVERVRDIRRMGTASLDLCAVAAGRLNAYFEEGLKPWDHAAGALIAAEAGATVTGRDGATAGGEFLLAAPPQLALHLEEALSAIHR
ncbi:inositol monophosphatase family protein [Marisediminicola sp. LYQ134]|uniref:inositol monophosphatase family protein n=1 Tax=unclassified Marisediminicola TaxID=2618316 RepID=UPI0039834C37